MDAKDIITNKSFCVLPLTGFELEPNGDVKNCIISKNELGNINNTNIENIMSGPENLKLKNSLDLKYVFKDIKNTSREYKK